MTTNDYVQKLPSLSDYRSEIIAEGASYPLPLLTCPPDGWLSILPPPPSGRTGWPWTVQSPPLNPITATIAPIISIVMPSFNQSAYIEEALRSVLLQNHPKLELIVIDGGSTDTTRSVLDRYRPWLSHLRIARDRGQAHAINIGFSLASDDGLRAWLNSDDFYLPGAFHLVAETHLRKNADFVYGDQLVLKQETGELECEAFPPVLERHLKFPAIVASHAAFWTAPRHRPVWEEHHCAIDYELWIRLIPGARKAYIPRPLGLVRHHNEAKTFSPAMAARWQEDAARNALAHPELYRSRPWIDLEHRLMKGFLRRSRAARIERNFAAMRRLCDWPHGSPVHPPAL